MKKLIGITLLAIAFSLNLSAQDKAQEKMSRAEVQAQKMAKELNLTPEQIEKKAIIDEATRAQYAEINKLRQEIMDKRAALPRDASDEQRNALSEAMKELREKQMNVRQAANEKIDAILTEEQRVKYKEMRTVKKPAGKTTPMPSK